MDDRNNIVSPLRGMTKGQAPNPEEDERRSFHLAFSSACFRRLSIGAVVAICEQGDKNWGIVRRVGPLPNYPLFAANTFSTVSMSAAGGNGFLNTGTSAGQSATISASA
jgi:hypothetical protein